MILSNHARTRCQQRGISHDVLKIILKYGRETNAPGDAQKIAFGKKECAKAISELKKYMKKVERAKNGVVVIKSFEIITVYKHS